MIVYIYVSLIFFVYIICCAIFYMSIEKQIERVREKKIYKIKNDFGFEISNHLNKLKTGQILTYSDIEYINKRLKKKYYMEVLNKIIVEFNMQDGNHIYTKVYMENFYKNIKREIKKENKKNMMKKIYFAFLLGEYGVDRRYINGYLIELLKTDSLYLRFNALSSISRIGNVDYFMKALKYMSSLDKYLNIKIFVDIIDKFNGDSEKLENALLKNLDEFNDTIQTIIITHFQNSNNEQVKEKLYLKLCTDDTNDEVRVSIIRYFYKVVYLKAENILLDLLQSSKWEFRAISAKTLSKYSSKETTKALLKSITDDNWYVRFNSALALLEFNMEDEIIDTVFDIRDKYAIDILFYALFTKNKISYDEYIAITESKE